MQRKRKELAASKHSDSNKPEDIEKADKIRAKVMHKFYHVNMFAKFFLSGAHDVKTRHNGKMG